MHLRPEAVHVPLPPTRYDVPLRVTHDPLQGVAVAVTHHPPLPSQRLFMRSSSMPRPELLETFPNPYPGRGYEIAMECPEFTSLCPLGGIESDAAELRQLEGGAPDFATMHIKYVPGDVCVELKSLKLYLWSFRNDG